MKRTYFLAVILILFSGCKKESLTENIVINKAQKQEDMALPDSNITTGMVRNELGESTNNVGKLCKSGKINMLSRNKPFRGTGQLGAETSLIYKNTNRILTGNKLNIHELFYNKPLGGVNSPYRLGDFRGYDHETPPYWDVELIDVKNLDNSTPQILYYGQRYKAELKVTENTDSFSPAELLSNPFSNTSYMSYLTDVDTFEWINLNMVKG